MRSEWSGPPNLTDGVRWTTWKGDAEIDNGCGVLRAASEPGELGLAGIATTQRQFNPGLTGSNGVEVTLVRNLQKGTPHAAQSADGDRDDLTELRFITGMALQIGSFYGQIGSEPDRSIHRGVQVHFDWITNWGLDWWLVRTIMPNDRNRYPVWDMNQETLQDYMKIGPHVTPPCFCLASTHYAQAGINSPFGHCLGLHLSNDGNQVHWTLDGVVRDTCDITGYFASCPQAVAKGAYLTISGVGFQPCSWTIEDLAIYACP